MMCSGDVKSLFLGWDITFYIFVLRDGKVFEIHSSFYLLFDFDKMISCA